MGQASGLRTPPQTTKYGLCFGNEALQRFPFWEESLDVSLLCISYEVGNFLDVTLVISFPGLPIT